MCDSGSDWKRCISRGVISFLIQCFVEITSALACLFYRNETIYTLVNEHAIKLKRKIRNFLSRRKLTCYHDKML